MPDPTPMPANFPAWEYEGGEVDVDVDFNGDVDVGIEEETDVESTSKVDFESAP